jgi:PKD repeat protein
VTWIPASGLYAGFTATPVEGQSPLQVQFTDKSFSSDPAGVQSWAWDFNNDQIVDSTAAEPAVHLHGRRLRQEVHGQPRGDGQLAPHE